MSVERITVNGRELTAFDLPPEPSETYTVSVDGLGEIVVEKGKPPKEKDVPAMYMRKLVPELCEQNAALFRENAKLREQLARMAEALGIDCEWADPNWCKSPCVLEFGCWPESDHTEIRCPAWATMRELGIEVDD